MKIINWIKQIFCNHKEFYEGWFVQQVRYRECKKCGLFEMESPKKERWNKLK